MKLKYILYIPLICFIGCSSSKMVEQWKSPDTDVYEANKVLVIGITPDKYTRRAFEQKLTDALGKRDVIAVKSIDFFERAFTEVQKSENQLSEIENQLLDAGFDAVIFTRVTGSEKKVTAIQSYRDFSRTFESFRDYYYGNQHLYYDEHSRNVYQVYHTETAVYCICPGKDRELLWKGSIDIVDPVKTERSVSDYVKLLIKELKKQQLLLVE